MTSRTNRHTKGRKQGDPGAAASSELEHRRQLAVARYLDGDPIEVICQEMGCAKSWLYKWKQRYRAAEATWSQERSRRPKTTPSKTPEAIEAVLIALRQTLSRDGSAPVSARVIRDHLRHHATTSIPSLRTIYRILNRQTKEEASPSTARHNSHDNLTPRPKPW
jgi:transposase-like protein